MNDYWTFRNQGYRAWEKGPDCPYEYGTFEYNAWFDGWHEANNAWHADIQANTIWIDFEVEDQKDD